jgi:uncharacterized membrane protein YkoI
MERKVRWIVGGAAGVALVAAGAGVAAATGGDGDGDGDDRAITGSALEQASRAALDETGGGRVTDTEAGDEESYYEVEVTFDDGREVDVQLDRSFDVVSTNDDDRNDADDAGDGND